jgi:ATP-dependent helicase/nuclease subunit B
VVVLLPTAAGVPRLRRQLLDAFGESAALVPPWTGTLRHFVQSRPGPPPALSHTERILALSDALRARRLNDPLGLSAGLLELFDELELAIPEILPGDLQALVAAGYGTPEPGGPLGREAQLVFDAWQAWREDYPGDPARQYAHRLDGPAPSLAHLVVLNPGNLGSRERAYLARLAEAADRYEILLNCQGPSPASAVLYQAWPQLEDQAATAGDNAYAAALEAAHDPRTDLASRARRFSQQVPELPAGEPLRLVAAADLEDEARLVDFLVRRWRLDGARHIGVVTNDRRLARRVRALLERAGISVEDTAGWRLSTTAAASTVDLWLEAVTQELAWPAVRPLLGSPFAGPGPLAPAEEELAELEHYWQRSRGGRPSHRPAVDGRRDALRAAARQLPAIGRRHSAGAWVSGLRASLATLGLESGLALDDAGRVLLDLLGELERAGHHHGSAMDWAGFRQWLGHALENSNFRPPVAGTGVELLALADARCHHFERLALAGCSARHLPASGQHSPFFNDGVRAQLGLATGAERRAAQYPDFRRLLESASQVCVSWHPDELEPGPPSPWVARLISFYQLGWGDDLSDPRLLACARQRAARIAPTDPLPAPAPPERPAPAAPRSRLPQAFSASSLQRLVDCPYRFFAADLLRLRDWRDPLASDDRSQFGEKVHRILKAFLGGESGLPGPFTGDLASRDGREAARVLLGQIAAAVFDPAAAGRAGDQAWMWRFEALVEPWLDWEQQQGLRTVATEVERERTIAPGVRLKGRLDRLAESLTTRPDRCRPWPT